MSTTNSASAKYLMAELEAVFLHPLYGDDPEQDIARMLVALSEHCTFLKPPAKTETRKNCGVIGCDYRHYARGVCSRHYFMVKRGRKLDASDNLADIFNASPSSHV